jgi:hypothetical protein
VAERGADAIGSLFHLDELGPALDGDSWPAEMSLEDRFGDVLSERDPPRVRRRDLAELDAQKAPAARVVVQRTNLHSCAQHFADDSHVVEDLERARVKERGTPRRVDARPLVDDANRGPVTRQLARHRETGGAPTDDENWPSVFHQCSGVSAFRGPGESQRKPNNCLASLGLVQGILAADLDATSSIGS